MADIPMNLEQAQAYYERPAIVRSAEDSSSSAFGVKIEILKEAALGIGVKAGLRKQLHHINGVIEAKQRELDTIYDFGNLMIQDRVVPAVITEARDLYNQVVIPYLGYSTMERVKPDSGEIPKGITRTCQLFRARPDYVAEADV